MYQEKGFKTIFDDVKAKAILKANIKEDEVIKPTKSFSINNDKFDYSLIVDDYKIPSFTYASDNSINDFYDFPDVTMSQNPEYKYKYPKLGIAETIKQQWQTEEGTPNELNRFLRHTENGESLDDIKEFDDVYTTGLNEINKMIDNDTEIIENMRDKSEGKANKQINKILTNRENKKENIILKAKADNPVKIGSAFPLPRFYDKSPNGRLANSNDIKSIVEKAYKGNNFDQDLDEAKILYSGYNKKANKKPQVKVPLNKGYKEPQNKNKEFTEKFKTAFKNSTPQKMMTRSEAKAQSEQLKTTFSGEPRRTIALTPTAPPPPKTPKTPKTPISLEQMKAIMQTKIDENRNTPARNLSSQFKPLLGNRPPVPRNAPQSPSKEAIKDQLPSEKVTPEEINKITKLQSKVRGNIAKKLVEEKRKSIDTSDEKTVILDTNPQAESFKINQNAYNQILAKYKNKPDTYTIDQFKGEDLVKIRGLMKSLSINLNTKRLDKLRNKFKT
jgi:hypothetical protein